MSSSKGSTPFESAQAYFYVLLFFCQKNSPLSVNRKPRKKTSGTELSFNAAYFFSTQQYLVILPLLSILHRL